MDKLFIKGRVLSLLRQAFLPVRLLWLGNLPLVIYYTALLTLTFFLAEKIILFIDTQAQSIQLQLAEPSGLVDKTGRALGVLCRILTVPIVLVVFTLPVKSIWSHQRFNFFEVLTQTGPGVISAMRSCYLSLRAAFWFLIPVAAIAFLFVAFIRDYSGEQFYQFCLAAACAVGALVLYRMVPLLLAPVLVLAGDAAPADALSWSFDLLSSKRARVVTNIAVTVGLTWLLLKGASLSPRTASHMAEIQAGILIISAWYLVTLLTSIVLEACHEWITLARQLEEQKALASVLQQQRLLEAAQQAVSTPQPIDAPFKVTSVWTDKK